MKIEPKTESDTKASVTRKSTRSRTNLIEQNKTVEVKEESKSSISIKNEPKIEPVDDVKEKNEPKSEKKPTKRSLDTVKTETDDEPTTSKVIRRSSRSVRLKKSVDYNENDGENDENEKEIDVDYEAKENDESESEKTEKSSNKKNKSSTIKSNCGAKVWKSCYSGKKISQKKSTNDDDDAEEIKTLKFSGSIPVDEIFMEYHGNNFKVFREKETIWDCMLNQTNLQYNNNKYYVIQLLEDPSGKNYVVWMRWGRVGKIGQSMLHQCGINLNQAKQLYEDKFYVKTGNRWDEKDSFEKYPGKYDLVHKDYCLENDKKEEVKAEEIKDEIKEEEKVEIPPSKLDKRVQDLIEMVCNITEMENLLKEMKYDAKKSPLGKLSKSQITAGYSALKKIEEHIINNQLSGTQFLEANNMFYTRIPHDFGRKVPPMIRTMQQLREKMKLLDILGEVEVAVKIMNQKSDILNPIDRAYDQLQCKLKPVNEDEAIYSIINDYVTKTHAPTHNTYKLKLKNVFEAEKPGEKEKFKDLGNRMLLWHGSRLTNWAGILSDGLRIAPPEAPVTGYMFGKGCYFADCSSKSANYCYATSRKNKGIISLSEVCNFSSS
jgi:poly [ADP-ribose] polymerase 2/3/4